jgi:hypothetical protein
MMTGATGAVATVKMALLELMVPVELLTLTLNCEPLSPSTTGGVV